MEDRIRRLRRMADSVEWLYKHGEISSQDPARMTISDINIFGSREAKLRGRETLRREMGTLCELCEFSGNLNGILATNQLKAFRPPSSRTPLPPMLEEDEQKIMDASEMVTENDFMTLRAFAATMLSVKGGVRSEELPYVKAENYDPETGRLYLDHVKGMDSYGENRWTMLKPEALPFMKRYLAAREERLRANDVFSPYMFFNDHTGDHLGKNMSATMRARVTKLTGVKFDFRQCRRTFADRCIHEKVDSEDLRSVLGHTDLRTLSVYYGRISSDDASRNLRKFWEKKDRT